MNPATQRLADVVYLNSPQVFCFACLATQYGLNEHDIRAAALVLVARAGLGLARRMCQSCRHVGEVLVTPVAA
jgi:hypothetical protein